MVDYIKPVAPLQVVKPVENKAKNPSGGDVSSTQAAEPKDAISLSEEAQALGRAEQEAKQVAQSLAQDVNRPLSNDPVRLNELL